MENVQRFRYPRTPHLPFSPGVGRDDMMFGDLSWFKDYTVVVTDKCDGECTTIYPDGYCHARSMDSRHHPSRSWIKGQAAEWACKIPRNHRVCGEYLYAEHSIPYSELESFFYVFAVFNGERCLSWANTVAIAEDIGIPTVPVLYYGPWDEKIVRRCWTGKSKLGGEQEGFVVRVAEHFDIEEFHRSVAKYVRAGHVQPDDDHWTSQPFRMNRLRQLATT